MRLFGRKKRQSREASTYRNSSVVERIQRDAGVDRDTAGAWFSEMLLFLDLVAASDHFISPPGPVDVAWHAFILHTRDYEAYCRERYGRIIHHQPTGEPDAAAYRRAYQSRSSSRTPMNHAIWADPGVVTGAALLGGAVGGEDEKDEHDGGGAHSVHGPEGVPSFSDQEGDRGGGQDGGQAGESGGGSDAGGGDSGGSSCGGSSCGSSSCGGGSG